MEEILKSLIIENFKLQLLSIPLLLFTIAISYSKLRCSFKWLLHRITLIILITTSLLISVYLITPSFINYNLSSDLDNEIILEGYEEEKLEEEAESESSPEVVGLTEANYKENSIITPLRKFNVTRPSPGILGAIVHSEAKRLDLSSLLYVVFIISMFNIGIVVFRLVNQFREERKLRTDSTTDKNRGVTVYFSNKIKSPFSSGIIRKSIYIPLKYKERDNLEGIFIHELAHLSKSHPLWALLEIIYQSIFWFNPLIYLYKNRGELIREIQADNEATKAGDSLEYCSLIVNELESFKSNGSIYYSLGFSKVSKINERVQNLLGINKKRAGLLIKGVAVLVSITFGIVLYSVVSSTSIDINDPNDLSYVKKSEFSNLSEKLIKTVSGIVYNNQMEATRDGGYILAHIDKSHISYSKFDNKDSLVKILKLPNVKGVIQHFTVDEKDNLYIFNSSSITKDGTLYKYDWNGNSEEVISLEDIGQLGVYKLDIAPDGRIYINCTDHIFQVKDSKVEKRISQIGYVKAFDIAESGEFVFTNWGDEENIHRGVRLKYPDSTITTNYKNSAIYCESDSIFILDDRGIKEYIGEEFKGYVAINEDFPELIGHFETNMIKVGERFLITYLNDYGSSPDELNVYEIKLTKRKRRKEKRDIVTISSLPGHYSSLDYAAKVFNKSQNRVKVEIVQYSVPEDNYSYYEKKMSTKVLSNDSDDIIFLPGLVYENFIKKGALANLSELIANDESFNESDYFKAYSSINFNDNLYALTTSFYASDMTFLVRKSLMEKYGFSEDYIELPWKELLEICRSEKVKDSYGHEVKPIAMESFNLTEFIYFTSSSNNFFIENDQLNRDRFSDFLDVISILKNEGLINRKANGGYNTVEAILEGSTLFIESDLSILSLAYQYEKHFTMEKMVTVLPTFKDNRYSIEPIMYGISNSSKYKKEAWEFIKSLADYDYQYKKVKFSLPVNKEAYWTKIKSFQENSEGTQLSFYSPQGVIGFQGAVTPTDSELQAHVDFIDKFKDDVYRDDDMEKFIAKEALAFANSKKSKEEVISSVNERLKIYLNE